METIIALNRRLVERYGTDMYLRARYRVVWADDQFEKREAEFHDFIAPAHMVRRVKEVRLVRKYPDFLGRHVLETLTYCPFPEVKDHNGYEPLFVFQRNDSTPLIPIWSAIEFIIKRVTTKVVPMSPSTMAENEEREKDKEAQEFLAMLEAPPGTISEKPMIGRITIETPSKTFGESNG
jgi:hypothetical protein